MEEEHWEVVETVNSDIQAELLKGLLLAQGIQAIISKEGAGRAYGLTVGKLGEAQILVPTSSKALAMQILEAYYAGGFEASAGENDNLGTGAPEEDH